VALTDRERVAVEAALGYAFRNPDLAEQALTHRSLLSEHRVPVSNEPLEFLGDAVLGFVVSEILHRRDPHGAEGDKTRIRARLVSTPTLVSIARSFDLGALVRMSVGEEKNDGRRHDKVQEDAVEALIAAVYLDGGIDAARAVVSRLFEPRSRRRIARHEGREGRLAGVPPGAGARPARLRDRRPRGAGASAKTPRPLPRGRGSARARSWPHPQEGRASGGAGGPRGARAT
jgi:hypothetical protein